MIYILWAASSVALSAVWYWAGREAGRAEWRKVLTDRARYALERMRAWARASGDVHKAEAKRRAQENETHL